MYKRIPLWLIVAGSVLYAILFYSKPLGLNLLIFNFFILGTLLVFKRINFKNFHHTLLFISTLLTGVVSVLTHSGLSVFMNYMSIILLSGAAVFPETRSIISLLGIKFLNVAYAFLDLFTRETPKDKKSSFTSKLWRFLTVVTIPLLVVILFIVIYRGASPWFDEAAGKVFGGINDFLISVFGEINWGWFGTVVWGFLFLLWLLLGKAHPGIVSYELTAEDVLYRKRRRNIKYQGKKTALKTEFRSAVVLFASLNVILLIVNVLDVVNVWFGFKWDGDVLKQFVHEGTWLLVFSILISIALVLVHFRRNLNFFSKNKSLKILAYIWIVQNIVLTVSVAVRNIIYIDYFNLAYKRIGVMFFLLAVVIGLFTVVVKIYKRKTNFFVFRYNALSVFVLFLIMSMFNWDIIIAKYNFSHVNSGFVHYDYLSSLSEKALPYLKKDMGELKNISDVQAAEFSLLSRDYFMTAEEYYDVVNTRIKHFVDEYPERHWLSWNYADYKAYQKLK